MDFWDLISDITLILPDFVSDKQLSPKVRKIILVVLAVASFCYFCICAYCIFLGIRKENIVILILGIICLLLELFRFIKAIISYKKAQGIMNKENIKNFFDNIAPQWDNEPIADTEIINRILDNAEIVNGINVLDIACGTGVLFPYYLERNVKSITAVDLSPEMVKIAKSKFPQVDVICGDAEEISFDRDFDCVMIYNAFPHFPNPQGVIENLARALKSGGRFTIAHGMSKTELDAIHKKSAGKVSNPLPETEELSKLLEPYFNVDITISDDKIYLVSGKKK